MTKNCDNCDKPIQAPDDAAGKKVKCPHCGDINLFPATALHGSATDPAPKPDAVTPKGAGSSLPGASDPEQTVLKLRPEMFRARPLTFSGLCLVLLASAIGAGYGLLSTSGSQVLGWVCIAAGAMTLGVFGVWKIRNLGSCLEVTNKRTIERLGLFSRFTSEIMHEDVRNVQITQSFAERILGVGRIGISSAGQEGLEIQVKDIRNPDRIRETIDRYRPM